MRVPTENTRFGLMDDLLYGVHHIVDPGLQSLQLSLLQNIVGALDTTGDLRGEALGLPHYSPRNPQQLAVERLEFLFSLLPFGPAGPCNLRHPALHAPHAVPHLGSDYAGDG